MANAAINVGSLVRFAKPCPDEVALRFTVLEHNGDRVRVRALDTGMSIAPEYVYPLADLVLAE